MFPFFKQLDAMDCGPSCLRMIAKFYGRNYSLQTLREKSYISSDGVSMLGISEAAESIGLRTMGVSLSYKQLTEETPLPCIVHWKQKHFIVVYKIRKERVYVADPAIGLVKYSKQDFLEGWLSTAGDKEGRGLCLLLETTPDFYQQDDEKLDKSGFRFLFLYLKPYKKFIFQLALGLFMGSIILLIFPFLTQSVVDIGINNQDLGFIILILIAQLVLFISRMSVDFIRGWILLHLGTRINISLISDFLIKMMKLPMQFFNTKTIGDLLQRIDDHRRIESFLTTSTLNILFSLFNLVIFGIVLAIYSLKILFIFLLGTVLYALWVSMFLRKRRILDFKRFKQLSDNQSAVIQLITGIEEIKLNNCDKQKRWEWENIQTRLFKINVRNLSLNQYQQAGAVFINETKNILIAFVAALAVINGDMTLGKLLAVQYIIGQLNSPVSQIISFFNRIQDARISLERLGEIHTKEDEEPADKKLINIFPENKSLNIKDLSFHYEGLHSPVVLNNINLNIPENKTTAIVGTSGSGKTTLIKLLLGFFPPSSGEIKIGDIHLNNFSNRLWRRKCGVVMQEGFIFADTLANNITISSEGINQEKLLNSVRMANIQDFIESLPNGYNTRIGLNGYGISQGQKQRILIARAIYKDPEYLFLDEATNALDANNEKIIIQNLNKFFTGKTVVIVAHRLSTVKNAGQIVVLDKGEIVEKGIHEKLIKSEGAYFNLIKDQLELGK